MPLSQGNVDHISKVGCKEDGVCWIIGEVELRNIKDCGKSGRCCNCIPHGRGVKSSTPHSWHWRSSVSDLGQKDFHRPLKGKISSPKTLRTLWAYSCWHRASCDSSLSPCSNLCISWDMIWLYSTGTYWSTHSPSYPFQCFLILTHFSCPAIQVWRSSGLNSHWNLYFDLQGRMHVDVRNTSWMANKKYALYSDGANWHQPNTIIHVSLCDIPASWISIRELDVLIVVHILCKLACRVCKVKNTAHLMRIVNCPSISKILIDYVHYQPIDFLWVGCLLVSWSLCVSHILPLLWTARGSSLLLLCVLWWFLQCSPFPCGQC